VINKTIIITGVHHTPAIELINHLRQDTHFSWKIFYLTHKFSSDNHLDDPVFKKKDIQIINIPSGKLDRISLFNTIKGIPLTLFSFFRSFYLIRQIKPNLVVSFGGYVSVPVIIASRVNQIKSIIHEQTLTISLTTKICSLFVNKIALSFDTKNNLPPSKTIVTGNLVRQQLYQTNRSTFNPLQKQIKKYPLIYITGGNQGSAIINQHLINSLSKLTNFTIIHQTGKNKNIIQNYHHSRYYQTEYISSQDIGWIFKHANLIIGRAGANTCFEIFTFNQKAILIPLPFSQQNEQQLNANWLQNKSPNNIIIINQDQLTSTKLVNSILRLSKVNNQVNFKPSSAIHPFFKLFYEMV